MGHPPLEGRAREHPQGLGRLRQPPALGSQVRGYAGSGLRSFPEDYLGLRPGYIKPARIAWYASHHHTAAGLNVPYEYSYLFAYPIPLDSTHKLTLPNSPTLRILAISTSTAGPQVTPAQPLFDTLNAATPGAVNPYKP